MIAEGNGNSQFGEGENTSSIRLIERSLVVKGMTCGACVSHVERALRGVSGVAEANASLERNTVHILYDPVATGFAALQEAVGAAGYELREDGASDQDASADVSVHAVPLRAITWPAIIGLVAATVLASLYILIVGITQDFKHAIDLVMQDWYFVVPITIGFGIQIGLFVYVRNVLKLRKTTRSANAVAGAGTGTSTVSMIACCAHHLTDILPVLGLSGAAVFLNDNRGPFMALGIVVNLLGIAVMVRMIRKIRSHTCHAQ